MDVQEVFKSVTRQFGDETGGQIDINDIIRWINEGQFQIARRTGDLNGITNPAISVLVGIRTYDLPSDFFKVTIGELDGKRLQLLSEAQLNTLYPNISSSEAQQGVPKFFSIVAGGASLSKISLAPIPGSTGSLTVTYKSRPPIINASDDPLSIAEEYHTTLVTFCLAKAKQLDGDDTGFATLTAAFKSEVAEDQHDGRNKDDETYPFIRASSGDYC